MEYILFIHNNADKPSLEEDWTHFFELAQSSGLFQGGSAIGQRIQLGSKAVPDTTQSVAGYMRFESSDFDAIKRLLQQHPVYKNGGTLELCELPKS